MSGGRSNLSENLLDEKEQNSETAQEDLSSMIDSQQSQLNALLNLFDPGIISDDATADSAIIIITNTLKKLEQLIPANIRNHTFTDLIMRLVIMVEYKDEMNLDNIIILHQLALSLIPSTAENLHQIIICKMYLVALYTLKGEGDLASLNKARELIKTIGDKITLRDFAGEYNILYNDEIFTWEAEELGRAYYELNDIESAEYCYQIHGQWNAPCESNDWKGRGNYESTLGLILCRFKKNEPEQAYLLLNQFIEKHEKNATHNLYIHKLAFLVARACKKKSLYSRANETCLLALTTKIKYALRENYSPVSILDIVNFLNDINSPYAGPLSSIQDINNCKDNCACIRFLAGLNSAIESGDQKIVEIYLALAEKGIQSFPYRQACSEYFQSQENQENFIAEVAKAKEKHQQFSNYSSLTLKDKIVYSPFFAVRLVGQIVEQQQTIKNLGKEVSQLKSSLQPATIRPTLTDEKKEEQKRGCKRSNDIRNYFFKSDDHADDERSLKRAKPDTEAQNKDEMKNESAETIMPAPSGTGNTTSRV